MEEFKKSLFQPIVGTNLHLLRESLEKGIEGAMELLEGVEERNPAAFKVEVKKIKHGGGQPQVKFN